MHLAPLQPPLVFLWALCFGPFAYPIYISPLFDITASHGVGVHMYADDTQLYVSFKAENSDATRLFVECSICKYLQKVFFGACV